MLLDKVVDMPVIVNDRILHSGGASIQLIACLRRHSSCATQMTGAVLDMVETPVVFNDRCWSLGAQKLRILRSCSSFTRFGRPCDYAEMCLAVGGATDTVHRLIWWTPRLHRDRLQLGTWLRRIFWGTCVSHRCRWCRSRREFTPR